MNAEQTRVEMGHDWPAAIRPTKNAKYSHNLYRWLTQSHHAGSSRVYQDDAGTMWIGVLDTGDLFGTRLYGVLCNGRREETAFWVGLKGLREVADFWPRYVRDGRCAIDTEHSQYFIGDETRWRVVGDTRTCIWCGNAQQTLQRWTETVERTAWTNAGRDASTP